MWPWYLVSFAQGVNIISRLMMLLPHATRNNEGVQDFNAAYVIIAVVGDAPFRLRDLVQRAAGGAQKLAPSDVAPRSPDIDNYSRVYSFHRFDAGIAVAQSRGGARHQGGGFRWPDEPVLASMLKNAFRTTL